MNTLSSGHRRSTSLQLSFTTSLQGLRVCVCIHVCACMCVWMCVCAACMCVCVYVHVYVCVCVTINIYYSVPQHTLSRKSSTATKSKVLLKRKNVILALLVGLGGGGSLIGMIGLGVHLSWCALSVIFCMYMDCATMPSVAWFPISPTVD